MGPDETNEHLFGGETSMEVLCSVVNEQPRRAGELAPFDVPAKLDELISSCLEKDPHDRPDGMEVVIEVLDSLASILPWSQAEARLASQSRELEGNSTPADSQMQPIV